MIDPDGEFAFLPFLIVGGMVASAVVGGYLGGAAANNSWNPTEWNFKKASTWVAVLGGGLSGAFLPIGFTFSVAAVAAWGASTTLAVCVTVGLGITMAGFSVFAHSPKGELDFLLYKHKKRIKSYMNELIL